MRGRFWWAAIGLGQRLLFSFANTLWRRIIIIILFYFLNSKRIRVSGFFRKLPYPRIRIIPIPIHVSVSVQLRLPLGLLCHWNPQMNNKKYKKWVQWKPLANTVILGMYLSEIKRIYGSLHIILQYLLVSPHIIYPHA